MYGNFLFIGFLEKKQDPLFPKNSLRIQLNYYCRKKSLLKVPLIITYNSVFAKGNPSRYLMWSCLKDSLPLFNRQ